MNRPCPVCASAGPHPHPVLTKADLHLVRCRTCGMVLASPLPAEASEDYYDQLGRPFYLSPDKLEGDYASVRFERELRLLQRFKPRGHLLDVGCSTGAFLHQVATRFPYAYHATGIEISSAALQYAWSRGLEVIDASLLSHDFGQRRFDVVSFWAVLEHLPDPAAFLRRTRALLQPGGVVLVLVPNFQALAVRLLGARYRYILPQHVNYFTSATLASLLRRTGFNILASGGSHFNPVVLWQDWRRGNERGVPDAERAALLVRTNRLKRNPALAPARVALSLAERLLGAAGLADNLWIAANRPDSDCSRPESPPS